MATNSLANRWQVQRLEADDLEHRIRDRLQGTAPLTIRAQYFSAIGRGDLAFVHAAESAPQAFALLDADTLEQGAQMRIARPTDEQLHTIGQFYPMRDHIE